MNFRHRLRLFGIVALNFFYLLVESYEVNVVLMTDDFSSKLRFVVFLADVTRLVVEKAVRVAQPGNRSKKHTTFEFDMSQVVLT